MNTINQARAAIASATNLVDLLAALRATNALSDEDQDLIDWTDLPAFGGVAPNHTMAVWSWDGENLLIGTCADDIKIISRAEMWEAWIDGNRDGAVQFEVPFTGAFEVPQSVADALGVDDCSQLNVSRV